MDYVKNIDLCRCLSLLLVVCTQKVEEFTAPVAGEYKLECWGAQGFSWYKNAGLGGYSKGNYILKVPIYICVGGSKNFYNNQIGSITSFYSGCPGGGTTSITTTNKGELKKFKDSQGEVILVAGGGGGADGQYGFGGAGGGAEGLPARKNKGSNKSFGSGGTQTQGGISDYGCYVNAVGTYYSSDFGVGGIGDVQGDFGAQGGSGWFGGGGAVGAGAAGGGSSHGNIKLLVPDSYKTIDGDHDMPSPNGGTETGHTGDGVCIVTQVSF